MRLADARNGPGFFLPMNKRVVFYVDGFNLYHSILEASAYSGYGNKLKWLDLDHLLQTYLSPDERLIRIKYFSAIYTHNPSKAQRHKRYIKVLKHKNVDVILGKFKRKSLRCKKCKQKYQTFEEKRTDVNIAIHVIRDAYKDIYDTAIIVSGDTDLIPAIKMLKEDFPSKQIGVVFPYGRKNLELEKNVNFSRKIFLEDMEKSILPEKYHISDTIELTIPKEWS